MSLLALSFSLVLFVLQGVAQEAETLPPPCLLQGNLTPGASLLQPFSTPLLNGSVLRYDGSQESATLLPLVLIVLDLVDDYGSILLALDTVSIDSFILRGPPKQGTYAFTGVQRDRIAAVESFILQRMKECHLSTAQINAWMDRMAFLADAATDLPPALASVLVAWPSPRLNIGMDEGCGQDDSQVDIRMPNARKVGSQRYPRIDGANECFMTPYAKEHDQIAPPLLQGCDPQARNNSLMKGRFVLLNATDERLCPPSQAVAWARQLAPYAKGVIIGVDGSPPMLGRSCTDVFFDNPFIPSVVSSTTLREFASALSSRAPVNFTFDYTCDMGYGFVVDRQGRLNHLGWRKVNTLLFYAWERDMIDYLDVTDRHASTAAHSITIFPPNTPINPASKTAMTLSPHLVRNYTSALFDFRLTCPSLDEADCGPWDRIVSATASCRPKTSSTLSHDVSPFSSPNPSPAIALVGGTMEIEVARWITPFRRGTGRWLTSASVFVGLLGNGTLVQDQREDETPWECVISVDVCCEHWTVSLTLLLFNDTSSLDPALPSSSSSPSVLPSPFSPKYSPYPLSSAISSRPQPFQVTPIIYSNTGTTFDKHYNENRTVKIRTPAHAVRAQLFALISGHGASPPPPVDVGCEYAPTSHAWSVNGQGMFDKYNTSLIAYQQYMTAGSPLGCIDKLGIGVIANQHGDYPDGRNGWCPGWSVMPLLVDITENVHMEAEALNSLTYRALSYYVGRPPDWIPYNASESGCGGNIVMSSAILWYN